MFAPAYLDHNATTPVAPEVLAAMLPWFSERFGNASSRHEYGRAARAAVDGARQQVAAALGAHPTEVIFTSGGSEANNLWLKGVTADRPPECFAVSAIEHPCVLKPAEQLVRRGWRLLRIPVDASGCVESAAYHDILRSTPTTVSVMLANNETGAIHDVSTLAASALKAGATFHTDAAQALGKIAVDFRALNLAGLRAMTVSSHKIYGPKGAAALIVDKRIELQPLIAGGGHERGLRSGTENVAAIVGFGLACELAVQSLTELPARLKVLQSHLEIGLRELGAKIFGEAAMRLPNTSYFSFPEIDGETLVGKLDRAGFAVASGAACSSAQPEPSHVLAAMGVAPDVARGAVRVSLGRGNTLTEIDEFLKTLAETLRQLKQMTAVVI